MATTITAVPVGASELGKFQGQPPLVHLGKVKKKQAKKLKRGEAGMLSAEVGQSVHLLQSGLNGNPLPVYISYEEKPGKKKNKKKKKIKFMGLKIDRKKLKKRMGKSGISAKFI